MWRRVISSIEIMATFHGQLSVMTETKWSCSLWKILYHFFQVESCHRRKLSWTKKLFCDSIATVRFNLNNNAYSTMSIRRIHSETRGHFQEATLTFTRIFINNHCSPLWIQMIGLPTKCRPGNPSNIFIYAMICKVGVNLFH